MDIAIITGASSGLGAEFARQIDRNERLDAIWGIARREDRLEEIGRELKHPFRAMRCDLTKKESFMQIDELLKKENPNVKILVNAAGFGKIGAWSDISLQDCEDMIDLNCKAAVKMTQLVLPYMEKGGRILEIASTAGFQSFPYLNVYASTKAFLYRYSRALRVELFGRGIHVTAVLSLLGERYGVYRRVKTDKQQSVYPSFSAGIPKEKRGGRSSVCCQSGPSGGNTGNRLYPAPDCRQIYSK